MAAGRNPHRGRVKKLKPVEASWGLCDEPTVCAHRPGGDRLTGAWYDLRPRTEALDPSIRPRRPWHQVYSLSPKVFGNVPRPAHPRRGAGPLSEGTHCGYLRLAHDNQASAYTSEQPWDHSTAKSAWSPAADAELE